MVASVKFVAGLTIFTSAPGTLPPEESVTFPAMEPYSTWPYAAPGARPHIASARHTPSVSRSLSCLSAMSRFLSDFSTTLLRGSPSRPSPANQGLGYHWAGPDRMSRRKWGSGYEGIPSRPPGNVFMHPHPRPAVLALACAVAAVLAPCLPAGLAPQKKGPPPESSVQVDPIRFRDVAAAAGLDFRLENSP